MDSSNRVTPAASGAAASVGATSTPVTSAPAPSAKRLRAALVDHLRNAGTLRTPRLEAAMRAVPRHVFVPAVPVEQAYADTPLYTKHDAAGVSVSAASQPTIVAMMLEQLQVEEGHAVLEVGAGTGYNAALLGYLTGRAGQVTTIDLDQDLVDGARGALAAAGYAQVRVVRADGAHGYPGGALYDRVVATVGAHGVPSAWMNQLAPGGRLVVPLRLRGSVSRSVVFERDHCGRWRDVGSEMCTFLPLRGIADDARHTIPLAPDGTVCLETHQDQLADPGAMADVLRQRRVAAWTGVAFGGMESMEWLYLWLACTMPNALSRMPVKQAAVDHGVVTPQFGWGAMAAFDQGNLAYLTVRKHDRAPEGDPRYEIGLIGHGAGGDELVDRVVDAVHAWDRGHRSDTVDFEIQPTAVHTATGTGVEVEVMPADPKAGQFVIGTPLNRIIVTWH